MDGLGLPLLLLGGTVCIWNEAASLFFVEALLVEAAATPASGATLADGGGPKSDIKGREEEVGFVCFVAAAAVLVPAVDGRG